MPRPKEPIALIEAKGKKHLTKSEIEERKASEVTAAPPKRIQVPKWLPAGLAKDYRQLARQLTELGIFSELDSDILGRYLMAQECYLSASAHLAEGLDEGDAEKVTEWSQLQDRFFKQATTSARELGLTVTSRCRLVVPAAKDEPDDPDADLFA